MTATRRPIAEEIQLKAETRSPSVAAVIIGARLGESEHIDDNKKMLEIEFDAEDIQIIQNAQAELQAIPGDCGDEYRKPPFLTARFNLAPCASNTHCRYFC